MVLLSKLISKQFKSNGEAAGSVLKTTRIRSMGTWSTVGVVGAVAVAGVAILCNLPTNPFVATPEKATLGYLEKTRLSTFGSEPKEFKASDLWKDNGAVIMAVRRPG